MTEAQTQGQVMPSHFQPRTRGRKPIYDIAPILDDLDTLGADQAGVWLGYVLEQRQARSAKKQLDAVGIEAAVETKDGQTHLYVKHAK